MTYGKNSSFGRFRVKYAPGSQNMPGQGRTWKVCPECGVPKPPGYYGSTGKGKGKAHKTCRDCRVAANKAMVEGDDRS